MDNHHIRNQQSSYKDPEFLMYMMIGYENDKALLNLGKKTILILANVNNTNRGAEYQEDKKNWRFFSGVIETKGRI